MVWAAVAIAAVALIVAFAALAKAGAAARELEDARLEAKRAANAAREELSEQVAITRQLLASVAEGARPTREMILDGQLWRDVDGVEATRMLEQGALRIVDVRTPQETAGGVLPGALLVPVDELEARLAELPNDGKRTLLYCAGGGRSAAACDFLTSKGYRELYNLAGGIGAWKGPISREKRS
ncbi:MAG: rhodanese-like domain-containing protein [Planctomycetes bacterium]|nr:rhodanese-like domain-containing protein [Planctomycetota bacterium]